MERPLLLFDLGGVVVELGWRPEKVRPVLGPDFTVGLLDELYCGPVYTEFMCGRATEEEVIADFLTRYSCRIPAALIRNLLMNKPEYVDGMTDCLAALEPAQMALVSNEGSAWFSYKVDRLGLRPRFSAVFASYMVGYLKPAECFFEALEARLNVSRSRWLLIDDSEEVCALAPSRGVRTLRFQGADHLRRNLALLGFDIPAVR